MHWCNNDKDVLEISTPEDMTEKAIEKELDNLEHEFEGSTHSKGCGRSDEQNLGIPPQIFILERKRQRRN